MLLDLIRRVLGFLAPTAVKAPVAVRTNDNDRIAKKRLRSG